MSDNEQHTDICNCEKCLEELEREFKVLEEVDSEFASMLRKLIEENKFGSIV